MQSITKFEVSRIIGLRALQLENGAPALFTEDDAVLKQDVMYMAAMELKQGLLDFKMNRVYPNNTTVQVNGTNMTLPDEVDHIIAIKRKQLQGTRAK
tara:strand:- start:28 stop:318 length:291 start_codon:yes stop_codon:yes gene_type:complete